MALLTEEYLRFKVIQKEVLEHLERLEKKEKSSLKKAFNEMQSLQKAKGYPVGTIREWKGKKFIKIAPNKWRPKYDSNSRGAKLSIAHLKKKIAACETPQEMMNIMLENRDRFSDKDGYPLPFVQKLSKFISDVQDKKFRDTHNKGVSELSDYIDKILNGTATEKESLKNKFFKVAETPEILKEIGLKGDNFTVKYGVISRHKNKDSEHNFTVNEWKIICKKLSNADNLVVTKYKDGFNIYLKVNESILLGIKVNSIKKDLEVNSIRTVFKKEIFENDKVLYPNSIKKITPEQKQLLAMNTMTIFSTTGDEKVISKYEEKNNRSEAMKGNQNAKKVFKKIEDDRAKINKARKEVGLSDIKLFDRVSSIKDSTLNPNSEDYAYKDTGYIAGSRKELAQNYILRMSREKKQVLDKYIDWDDLEENPRMAEKLITKSNIFGEVDWQSLKEGGMTGSAAFLIDRVYASAGSKPEDDSLSRKNYVIAMEGLRDRFEKCKSVQDVKDTLDEIYDEITGNFLEVKKYPEYKKLQEEYDETMKRYWAKNKKKNELDKKVLSASYKVSRFKNELTKKYFRLLKDRYADGSWEKTFEKMSDEEKNTFMELENIANKVQKERDDFEKENGWGEGERYHKGFLQEEEAMKTLDKKMNELMQVEGLKLILSNPLYAAWSSLGDKFIRLRRNKTFLSHSSDCRMGKYDDWKWLEKDKIKTKQTKQKAHFELQVASKLTRKGGRTVSVKSTQELKKMFNLRDIQSGNWVLKDPASAKFHVDRCCEGFADLCDITGISDNLVSLNGRLALAIGARGKGGKDAAAAHYEPI